MKIAAVVVTYNRIEKLKKALACYERQASYLNSIVVVDNKSNDGTSEYLQNWKERTPIKDAHVLTLPENLGGSGGFYAGENFALSLNVDWVFVADDDAYPSDNLFRMFDELASENRMLNYSAICAKVTNSDGSIAFEHRRRVKVKMGLKMTFIPSRIEDYNESFDIGVLSYVGSFLNVKALEKVGLCEKDFFIYADDAEHSLRLKKYGPILCVPSLEILHDWGYKTQNNSVLMSWRDYYFIRNEIFMRKRHYPLTNFHFVISKLILIAATSRKNIKCAKLILTAIKDGLLSNLGKHSIYKPGYEIKYQKNRVRA